MRTGTRVALLALALSSAPAGCAPKREEPIPATDWKQEAELVGEAGRASRAFGQVLALSGGLLAVTEGGDGASSVHLFRREGAGWRPEAHLGHPAGLRDVGFGFALSAAPGALLVGVPGEAGGAAYVFARDPGGGGWTVEARLEAPVGQGWFGRTVALRGGLAAVGAPTDGGTGAVYLYRRDGTGSWGPAGRITGSDTGPGDFFGGALAIDEGVLVVGAELHGDVGATGGLVPRRGAAYVFALQGGAWLEEAELCSCDAGAWDYLGFAVGVSGDVAVVGNAKQHAAAHVFARGKAGWVEEAELRAAEDEPTSGFGHQVAVSGDWAVIGAPYGEHDGQRAAGEAFAFRRSAGGWTQYRLLDTDDPGAHLDCFGDAVAIDGDTIAVSATADDEAGADAGAVYLYRLR